jgi:uncharacterized protein (DUF2237 family)
VKQILWTVGLGLAGCYSEVNASKSNCLLNQCDTQQDTLPNTHPTEQNVLSEPLTSCSTAPLTGFYRDGYCRTGNNDRGIHVVCAEMTEEFLVYTKSKGNDLSSPSPQYGFPGLKPGDHWCLCAARWAEAQEAKVAPKVVLEATSKATLELITLSTLQEYVAKQ